MSRVAATGELRLFSARGKRKYVGQTETARYLAATARMDAESRVFCQLLALTGCRLSEGLGLTPERLDVEAGGVVFQTLKRRKCVFRFVLIPPLLMRDLRQLAQGKQSTERLWGWCRQTAWRRVRWAMAEAGITGEKATPRGLRHGFGVATVEVGYPITKTRDLLGHADLQTTAIYLDVVGQEERELARRLWRRMPLEG